MSTHFFHFSFFSIHSLELYEQGTTLDPLSRRTASATGSPFVGVGDRRAGPSDGIADRFDAASAAFSCGSSGIFCTGVPVFRYRYVIFPYRYFPHFHPTSQKKFIERNLQNSRKYTDFRQLSLLFVRDVRKADFRQLSRISRNSGKIR